MELAFMVMLLQMPPLRRAVLIPRDVMGFSAAEVSGQLGTSAAAVNSTLQRARQSASAGLPERSQQSALRALGGEGTRDLARRYADAMEAGDVDTLLGMLTEDATWSMPPIPTWFQGHDTLRPWLLRDPLSQRWRHRPTRANGQLAVGCYLYDGERSCYTPAVIDVLTLSGGKIAAVTALLVRDDPGQAGFFARFGLPAGLPA